MSIIFTSPNKPLYLAVTTLLTGLSFSQASHADVGVPIPETILPEINVTATRTPTFAKNTIAQTVVIDENDLQRYRGQSVLDVLRGQAGFSVKQSGGDGTLSNFYLRGFDSKQILVLVDGIRYSSLSSGEGALNLLPADQIERIEVLEGASGSSLYGSDAMGGVIQVFTKGQNVPFSNVAVTLGAGTQNTTKAQITGQYRNQGTSLSLSAGQDKTDGIDSTLPTAPFNIHHPDKDGFDSNNYSLVAKHKLNDQIEVGITGLYSESTSHFDSSKYDFATNLSLPYRNTYSDQKNGATNAFANFTSGKLNANLKYGQSFDKSTTHDGSTPNGSKFDTKQQQANLQLGYKLPIGQIIGGAEWLKQSLDSTTQYNQKDRTVKSGFVGYQLNQPHYDLQAHVRQDDNSDYGSKTTYNVGGAVRVLPSTRIGASYATGFRAPSFNDAYYKSEFFNGNPNLNPETSKNSEIFIENQQKFANGKQKTRLAGYHSKLSDGIVISDDFSTMQNVEKATIKGVNLTSDWQKNNVLFGLNYDHQTAENDKTGKQLSYRPKDKGLAYIGYQQPSFDIRLESEYSGERFTNASNTKTLGDYTLLNISGNYYVNPNLSINTRLNNITDKQYQTAEGYRQKGINAFVSATYQWF